MCVRSAGLMAGCTHLHPLRVSSTAVLLLQVSKFWVLASARCFSGLDQDQVSWTLPVATHSQRLFGKVCGPNVPFPPTKTRTQEVTERWVQHPEEQQELPELSLHGLLTLLKVPVLWGEGHVKRWAPTPGRGPVSHPS